MSKPTVRVVCKWIDWRKIEQGTFIDVDPFDVDSGYYDDEVCRNTRNYSKSCAASPWTYRTDTGDETGKVVEAAELPDKNWKRELLFRFRFIGGYRHFVAYVTCHRDKTEIFIVGGVNEGDDWLRKHLVAWAEIRR